MHYVRYAHARIAGILRNAGDAEIGGAPAGPLRQEERDAVKRLADFPAIVREAAEHRAPQAIPVYAIGLADAYHRFYHECRVLGSESQAFRLGLCRATKHVRRARPRPRRGRGARPHVGAARAAHARDTLSRCGRAAAASRTIDHVKRSHRSLPLAVVAAGLVAPAVSSASGTTVRPAKKAPAQSHLRAHDG